MSSFFEENLKSSKNLFFYCLKVGIASTYEKYGINLRIT